tara:strand:- start:168 stop:692 length:525 start_codon:yes stop_codon:yes gene_type:complete
MNKENKTRKILITLSIIFIIVLVIDIVWFSFVKKEADKVLDFKKVAQVEAAQNYNLTELKRQINELEQKEKELDTIFVDKDNIVIFIETIENMAKQSGISTQIQIDDTKKDEGSYQSLDILLQATGSWSGVTTFLKMVENLPHHILVEGMKLNLFGDEDGTAWNIDIVFTIISQ